MDHGMPMTALELALQADSSQEGALVHFMPLYRAEELLQQELAQCSGLQRRERLGHALAALALSQMLLCKVWQACGQAGAGRPN